MNQIGKGAWLSLSLCFSFVIVESKELYATSHQNSIRSESVPRTQKEESPLLPPLPPPPTSQFFAQVHLSPAEIFFPWISVAHAVTREEWNLYVQSLEAWANHVSIGGNIRIRNETNNLISSIRQPRKDRKQIMDSYIVLLEALYGRTQEPHPLIRRAKAYRDTLGGSTDAFLKYSDFTDEYLRGAETNQTLRATLNDIRPLSQLSRTIANQTNRTPYLDQLLKDYSQFLSRYTAQVAPDSLPRPSSRSITVQTSPFSPPKRTQKTQTRFPESPSVGSHPQSPEHTPPQSPVSIGSVQVNLEEELPCSPFLRKFPRECRIQAKFNQAKASLKDQNINIDNLAEYKATRFIDRQCFEGGRPNCRPSHKDEPWLIYDPKPQTWSFWEKGNQFRERLSKTLAENEAKNGHWELTVKDLKDLHKKVIDESLLGPKMKALLKFRGVDKIIPRPGNFRNVSFFSGIGKPTKDEIDFVRDFDIRDEKGPYVTYNKLLNRVMYLKHDRIPEAITRLVKDINQQVNQYLYPQPGQRVKLSPIEFLAEVQRRFVAIHPFHEGIGRMSRMVQDLISERLGLPFIPGGDLQNDVLVPLQDYQTSTFEKLEQSVDKLTACASEHEQQDNPISPECTVLYACDDHQGIKKRMVKDYAHDLLTACKINLSDQDKFQAFLQDLNRISQGNTPQSSPPSTPPLSSFPEVKFEESPLTPEAKVKLIEALAEPLKEKETTYTWVASKAAGIEKQYLYTFPPYMRYKSKQGMHLDASMRDKLNARAGLGVYVATSPSDTLGYSFPGGDPENTKKSYGQLKVVEIQPGQKVLDYLNPSPQLQAALDAGLITENDLYTLPANVVIRYMVGKYGAAAGESYKVIRLNQKNAFKVRDPQPSDLLGFQREDIIELKTKLYEKQKAFKDLFDKTRKFWKREELPKLEGTAKARAQLGQRTPSILSPLGDCILFDRRGKATILDMEPNLAKLRAADWSSIDDDEFYLKICRCAQAAQNHTTRTPTPDDFEYTPFWEGTDGDPKDPRIEETCVLKSGSDDIMLRF